MTYNEKPLTGLAIAQKYHVISWEGLEYSYLTTGLANVQLQVSRDDTGTLYYELTLDMDTGVGALTEDRNCKVAVLVLDGLPF